ncbi:MAG TPA: hypothetical protein VGF31_05910, partial [Myxococcaceae bacterium]
MRTALGLAVFAVGIMACGTTPVDRGTVTGALKRDITLQGSATQEIQVASPVELGRAEPRNHNTPRRKPTPKPAPAPTTRESAPMAAPAPELVAAPAPVAVAEAPTPAPDANGRELAPGQTVQLIPASSGPSSAGPETTYVPTDGRGFKAGGGHCPTPPR